MLLRRAVRSGARFARARQFTAPPSPAPPPASPPASPPAPPAPPASVIGGMLGRLLPEDDPATRDFKDRERRVIYEQLRRGKLADALRAGSGRDKLFVAGPRAEGPTDANVAPFPDTPLEVVASELSGGERAAPLFASSAVTVVTLAFQGLGQQMLEPWHAELRDSPYGLHAPAWAAATAAASSPPPPLSLTTQPPPQVRLLNIVYLQGWIFRMLSSVMRSSTRAALAPDVARCSALTLQTSQQQMDHFCERLGLHNRMMGHVLLVDRAGRVRWRAHGPPARGEAANMLAAIAGLVTSEPPQRSKPA